MGNSPVGAGFIPDSQLQTQFINQHLCLLTAPVQQIQIGGILDIRITNSGIQLEFSLVTRMWIRIVIIFILRIRVNLFRICPGF
ncbi:hypothetical protein SDC9_169397 [bioreactor metagenome]|uniref:Uncharacterized protein n=1 Tax=bioreactor metagenome TaxID=1076179 RepID=A0A645GDB7_9ZZZZ